MPRSIKTAVLFLVFILSLTGVLIPGPPVSRSNYTSGAAPALKPNELGNLLILEYHLIRPEPGCWARSPQEFRRDLELLYRSGYQSLSMKDYLHGKMNIQTGKHPVIFTFDDSSPGQFRYLIRNGKKEIDPDCAVGMLIDFQRLHPDFGAKATFFVLPGADPPNRLFGQPEFELEKLAKLAELGFEIGNHTLWHANLKKYKEETVRKQLALAVKAIRSAVPGYEVEALALPFGLYPKDLGWAVKGAYNNVPYHNMAILKVAGGPAPSPFNSRWDPLHLPRIQVAGNALERLIRYYEAHPEEIYKSDGRPDTAVFPSDRESEYASSRFRSVSACAY